MERIEIIKCIFCDNPLDNSDEHIIPNSLNGKLHSKNIICQTCNAKFGKILDPPIKEMFNPILLALGFDNASSLYSEDPDGRKYLFDGRNATQVKPQETKISKNGLTYMKISGNPRDVKKYFEKRVKEFTKKGCKLLKNEYYEIISPSPPFGFGYKIEISPKLILELNKIALEYYAYNGLAVQKIKSILHRVNNFDETLDNVVFCNFGNDIRTKAAGEISHLIAIKTNKDGTLYCYIELFNTICAHIKLVENYSDEINFTYHQDVITGERFNEDIILNFDVEQIDSRHNEKFGILINSVFQSIRDRKFIKVSNEIFAKIKSQVQSEIDNGTLLEDKFVEEVIQRRCKAIADLTIYEFPYIIEDNKDEENDTYNYFHSNMREENFEEFNKLHKEWIGIKVTFPDDEIFHIDSFFSRPFIERNGIKLVKVYCVFVQKGTNLKRYIPYRDFFEGIGFPKAK